MRGRSRDAYDRRTQGGAGGGKRRERRYGAGSPRAFRGAGENRDWRAGGYRALGWRVCRAAASGGQPRDPRCSNRVGESVAGCASVSTNRYRPSGPRSPWWRRTERVGERRVEGRNTVFGSAVPGCQNRNSLQQGSRLTGQSSLGVQDLHPGSKTANRESLRFLIGKASQSPQMTPVSWRAPTVASLADMRGAV